MSNHLTIDTHVHVVSSDKDRYPLNRQDLLIKNEDDAWFTRSGMTAEQLLPMMAEAGVDGAVLVQLTSAYGDDNSYVADCAGRFPDSFTGLCMVDFRNDTAADDVDRWNGAPNMRGVRLFGDTQPPRAWLDDPRAEPVWQRVRDLAAPLCVIMRGRQIERLRRMVERYPEVPVVLDHLGGSRAHGGSINEGGEAFWELASFPNVYLKFSTLNTLYAEAIGVETKEFFRRLVGTFGADRLMWGSDYPSSRGHAYGDLLHQSRDHLSFLGPEDLSWLFGGTALRLWPSLGEKAPQD